MHREDEEDEADDGYSNEAARNEAAIREWSIVDCKGAECPGWLLTQSDTWVKCRGCNSKDVKPHPEWPDESELEPEATWNTHPGHLDGWPLTPFDSEAESDDLPF